MMANDAPRNKHEGLVYQLTLLAEAFNEPLTIERLKVYVMALGDLSEGQLTHGLNRAVRELTFWPRPAELYELCTGIRARKSDNVRADEAWQWVMTYLDRHGVEGRTLYELQGNTDFIFANGAICQHSTHYEQRRFPEDVFAVSAPFYILTTYSAPEIPELISATLTQLAGNVVSGLNRLSNARDAAAEGHGEGSSKDITFLRKDFTENYLNAVALKMERESGAMTVIAPPSRQLPGNVSSFSVVQRLPIRLYFYHGDWDELRYCMLPMAEATAAYEQGTLDEDAYGEAQRYWEQAQKNQCEQDAPADYWAWLVPKRDGCWQSGMPEPQNGYGVFRLEAYDGSSIVFPGMLLRLGGRQVELGERIHIRVSPSKLKERPSLDEVEVEDAQL